MISKCKDVEVDHAVAGMVLAAPVLDAQGGILLPNGTSLTDSILASLRRREIDTLVVVDDNISKEELEAERERMRARLERLFRRCQAQGGCGPLRRSIEEYRMGGGGL